jgi:hypothetical protein
MLRVAAATLLSVITTFGITAGAELSPVYEIDYVKAHLAELHGKTIRVHGQINECSSLTCLICTGPNDQAICLPFSIATGEPLRKSDNDREGFQKEERASDLIERLYRFATVTAEVTVDATCELGYDPSKGKDPNETIVCTDRSNALDEARIIRVDVRRSATEGRFDQYEGLSLRDSTATEGQPILEAWSEHWRAQNPKDRPKQTKVLMDKPDVTYGYSGIILCICLANDCTGRWPTRTGHLIESPGNPYRCYLATQYRNDWSFDQ